MTIDMFYKRLAQVVEPSTIPAWMDTPNPAFDGLKPLLGVTLEVRVEHVSTPWVGA